MAHNSLADQPVGGVTLDQSKHYHTLLAGGLWPALTHPYKHGSRRDLWISSNSHKGKSSASHVVPTQRRVVA